MQKNLGGKYFVMKQTYAVPQKKAWLIKQENKLLQLIDSEYVIKISEIYEWENKLYMLLPYMDGKSLTNVIEDYHT